MKHKELVDKAKYWLTFAKGCNPVFTERGSARLSEIPDAIGWNRDGCIIVECKTSKNDFNADLKKEFRANDAGLGKYRYYLVYIDLYKEIENIIPKNWGVITCDEYKNPLQMRMKGSSEFQSNLTAERDFLRSRILQIQRFGQ